jgi:hypothetical protein
MTYAFRIRFRQAPTAALGVQSVVLEMPAPGASQSAELRSWKGECAVRDSDQLLLVCEGLASESEADAAGRRYREALLRSCARIGVGLDFGQRAGRSFLTQCALDQLQQAAGVPVLNDEAGLMVFPSPPWPRFAKFNGKAVRHARQDRFVSCFASALAVAHPLTAREQVAFELYNAAFFQESVDARLLLMVSAVEALIESAPRSPAALAHVETLISATRAAALPPQERDPLLGALVRLRQESITRSGKQLIATRLPAREYSEVSGDELFARCYELRSRLVHGGQPSPSWREVSQAAAWLERLVGDLLSADLPPLQ